MKPWTAMWPDSIFLQVQKWVSNLESESMGYLGNGREHTYLPNNVNMQHQFQLRIMPVQPNTSHITEEDASSINAATHSITSGNWHHRIDVSEVTIVSCCRSSLAPPQQVILPKVLVRLPLEILHVSIIAVATSWRVAGAPIGDRRPAAMRGTPSWSRSTRRLLAAYAHCLERSHNSLGQSGGCRGVGNLESGRALLNLGSWRRRTIIELSLMLPSSVVIFR
jgi:hypothetical protein